MPCYAHQVNLYVGDMFKSVDKKKGCMSELAEQVLQVVNWFRNHSWAGGFLRDQQIKDGKSALALILPVLTQWTSQHACFTHLLEIKGSLQSLTYSQQADLLEVAGTKPDDKAKVSATLKLARDDDFWDGVKAIGSVLCPLAAAANVAQGNGTRVNQVFLLFGHLFKEYTAIQD